MPFPAASVWRAAVEYDLGAAGVVGLLLQAGAGDIAVIQRRRRLFFRELGAGGFGYGLAPLPRDADEPAEKDQSQKRHERGIEWVSPAPAPDALAGRDFASLDRLIV